MTISTELITLNTAISNIKTEIINKGQTVLSTDTVVSLSPKIDNISNKNGGNFSKNVLKDVVEGTIESLYDKELLYVRPYCFTGCERLKIARFTKLRKICRHAFDGCFQLKYLILDFYNSNNTDEIVRLDNINAFRHTFIGKGQGKIYVNDNLYSKYRQSTSGWYSFYSQIERISNMPNLQG